VGKTEGWYFHSANQYASALRFRYTFDTPVEPLDVPILRLLSQQAGLACILKLARRIMFNKT
jgi:hypothetical protein